MANCSEKSRAANHEFRPCTSLKTVVRFLTANKEIRTWNFADGTLLNSVPLQLADAKDYPSLYEFSHDGRLIAGQSNSRELAVTVWDAATGQIAHQIDVKGYPLCAAFSPDGRYVAIGSVAARGEVKSAGGVHTYDLASKMVVHAVSAEAQSINAVAFSPDGTLLAGGDHGNGRVTLWTTSDWKATRDCRRSQRPDLIAVVRAERPTAGVRRRRPWVDLQARVATNERGQSVGRSVGAASLLARRERRPNQ